MKRTIRSLILSTITLTLVLALTMFLASCGNKSEAVPGETTEFGNNAIAEYLNDGFQLWQSSCDETHWKGVLKMEDSWDQIYLAEAKMTSEIYEKYTGISYDDEDYDAKALAFITYLDDAKVTDISDKIPSQEELNKLFIGKTLGDLENEGFEDTGYSTNDDTGEASFYYDGPEYCINVSPEIGTKIDMDDMSKNDLRNLVIATVGFQGISSRMLD